MSCLPLAAYVVGVVDELVEFVGFSRLGQFDGCATARFEVVSPGEGGLVDPVAGEGLGEHVTGGLVFLGDGVGVVGVASSGEGGVDAVGVGGAVDEEEGGVDGAALGGVAGLGVTQI